MELGTGCLACRNQIGISSVNCWSKCGCFGYRFETVVFSLHSEHLSGTGNSSIFTSLTAYKWTGPGQAALYGCSVACRQVVFIWLTHENLWFSVCAAKSLFFPPFEFWLETVGAHLEVSRRLLSGSLIALVTQESGRTQSHPMDLLKHTAQVLPVYAGFCPVCLFFHFTASRLP